MIDKELRGAIEIAREISLLNDTDSIHNNPEYFRGQCELAAQICGLEVDDTASRVDFFEIVVYHMVYMDKKESKK